MVVIVSRSRWGASPPRRTPTRIATPTARVWVHHTATEQHGVRGMRDIQRFHQRTRGWNDIAYSFVIDDDGTIYEGRGAGVAGGHTAGDNSRSHGICLMGNFDGRAPRAAAVDSLVELARHGRDRGWWRPTLGGHRDARGAQTACPGRHLYLRLPAIRTRVSEEDDLPSIDDMKRAMREVLNEGTGPGQKSWRGTSHATLATVQANYNLLNALRGSVSRIDDLDAAALVDEAALAEQLLPGLVGVMGTESFARAIAEHLPVEDARDVVTELTSRLPE